MPEQARKLFERAETLKIAAVNYLTGEEKRQALRKARQLEARAYAILEGELA